MHHYSSKPIDGMGRIPPSEDHGIRQMVEIDTIQWGEKDYLR